MIKIITADEFKEEVVDYTGVAVVDFFLPTCGVCKELSGVLEKLEGEVENTRLVKVDVTNDEELAVNCGCECVPTMKFIKNAKIIDTHEGYMSKSDLKEKLITLTNA